jgi:hypothetical protein
MTKLSEDLVQKMCEMINAGRVSPQTLMEELGVAQASVSRWSTHGNSLLELHDGDRDATLTDIRTTFTKGDMKYAIGCVRFVTDIPAAFAELRGRLEMVAYEGGMNDPKIAIDILSRWDPKQWAKQLQVKQEVDERHTITQIVIHSSEQEVKQLEEPSAVEAEFCEV